VLASITNGFAALFTQMGAAGQIDLLAEQAKASDTSLSVIDERVADRIELRPDVRSVSKLVLGVSSAPGLPYFIVWGLDANEEYIRHYRIREGRGLERGHEVILGRFAANSLKKGVDDKIALGGSSFTIVGIFESGITYEDAGGVIALKEAQELFHKPRQASFLGIAVSDPARAAETARALEREYPELMVATVSTFTERLNDMAVTYAIVNALIVLTVVVGGIVMMNAMLMNVFERTQEIGVLRALGWRRRRIVRMVIVESLATSLLSGLAGIVFGVALSVSFTMIPDYGAFLTPAYTPEMFAQVLLLALLLGVIGGAYPAWRAANLRPIEALRYE
jgi:ABC-type antimicrobial peptide transport system permease subunit